jgi:NAD dependent epimerase/dehydratase family enzyme
VVVNLAAPGVFDKPWTTRNRERIVSSRVNTTGTLVRTLVDLADAGSAPALIQASGVAHYGTARTEQPHTEGLPRRERLPGPGHGRGLGAPDPGRRPQPAFGWC